ncbi:MAG TPA: hypothetical protein VJK02_06495 [Anaerolineales bacterium]|nr:hypothetical protein [Anaerolineales bacterium]
MKSSTSPERRVLLLSRVFIWGQIVGFLWYTISVVAASLTEGRGPEEARYLLWPIGMIVAVLAFKLDRVYAVRLPRLGLYGLTLVTSVITVYIAFTAVASYVGLPAYLLSIGSTRWLQVASFVTLTLFGAAFVVNSVAIIWASQARSEGPTEI